MLEYARLDNGGPRNFSQRTRNSPMLCFIKVCMVETIQHVEIASIPQCCVQTMADLGRRRGIGHRPCCPLEIAGLHYETLYTLCLKKPDP